MQKTWPQCLFIGLLYAATAVAADNQPLAQTPGVLAGRVVDVDGKPVADAHVWLQGDERKTIAEGRTDAAGRYRLTGVPPKQQYELLVDATGCGREYRTHVTVFPAAEAAMADFVVAPGRDVAGRILDADGKPKADVELEWKIYRYLHGSGVSDVGPAQRARTDADGRYRVRGLPPCSITGVGELFGFDLLEVDDYLVPGTQVAELPEGRLVADVPFVGTVKDTRGIPLAGIKVESNFIGNHDGLTDAAGHFELRGIPVDSRFRLMIDAPNFAYINRIVGPERTPVEVVLKPCVYLAGQIVDAQTGEPVRYSSLALCLATRELGGRIVRRGCRAIDAEQTEPGRFRLSCDEAEDHCLTVSAAGYDEREVFVDRARRTAEGDNLVVKLHRSGRALEQGQRLTGALRDANGPIGAAWVSLRAPEKLANVDSVPIQRGRMVLHRSSRANVAAVSEADGTYLLNVPYAGKWYVTVDEASGRRTIAGPIEIKLNEDRKLDVPAVEEGTIAGRVSGIPADWNGYLWLVAFDQTVHSAEVRVAKDGSFRLEHLPPGEYGLKVGHDGYADPEFRRGTANRDEFYKSLAKPADPWKDAVTVRVAVGETVRGIEVACPAPTRSAAELSAAKP